MDSPGPELTLDDMAEEQPPGTGEQPPRTGEQPPGTEDPSADDTDPVAEGEATEDRKLYRSSTDKVIAGVAGGIGAYFGIDSVIVRIGFIVLTFLGGAGPFLYLIGWLALPTEDSPSVIAKALGGNSPNRFRSLMAVGLIGLGLLITANLSGSLFGLLAGAWSIAPYLALILIVAGVALVLWPGPAGRPKSTPARPRAPQAPPPGTPPPSSAFAAPVQPTSSAFAAPAGPPPAAAGPEWSGAAPTGPPPPTAATPSPARARRERSSFGLFTVAALFVYTGTALMLDRLDVLEVDIVGFLAIAMAITGAGLLASAFVAPARGLIWLGIAISAPLSLFVAADVAWGPGIGESRVSVADVGELEDEYGHGIGQFIVDLRDLDPERTDHSVDLSLGIGELRVYVPDSISTTADVKVGVGSITGLEAGYVWYEKTTGGVGTERTIAVPLEGETTGELHLDINVGIGEAEVRTVPAPTDRTVRQ